MDKPKNTYELVETDNGNSFFCVNAGLFKVVNMTGSSVKNRNRIDITDKEFKALAERSKTHTLKFDKISKKVIATPKPMKSPTQKAG